MPDIIDDPAIVMLWGITRESLDAWLSADSGADSNEIKGFAASRGVVEGHRAHREVGGGDLAAARRATFSSAR